MKKTLEDSVEGSFRVGRTANTRLIRSSQLPKNFFSSQPSAKTQPKTRCS